MNFKKIITCLALMLSLAACQTNDSSKVDENNKVSISENKTSKKVLKSEDKSDVTSDELIKYDTVYYDYFDTVTTFAAYTKDEKEFEKYKEVLEKNLKKYNELYNTYDSFDGVNNISTINKNAGKKPVKVDKDIIELLEFCKDFYDKSDGKINIALGSLIKVWHNERELAIANPKKAELPKKELLEEAASHNDIDKIIIDKENSTVFIEDPDIQIDVGAIGKGYGLKKIEENLRKEGLNHAILSIGGDDVLIGDNPTKENGEFKIAIQNPDLSAEDPYSSIINLKDTTVVTSGDYQRFFKVDGKVYHHIIDPDTLYPSQYFKSVSVIHDDIALADALSTYLFIVDVQTGKKIAEKYGAEVFWIDNDFNEYRTDGYKNIED